MIEEIIAEKPVKMQPGWKNEPSQGDLEADLIESETAQDVVRTNVLGWRETKDGGKPIRARTGRSTVRPKVVRKTYEWKYPSLEEPFLNTTDMYDAKPRTGEDNKSAKMNGLLLNYQWREKIGKVRLVKNIVRKIVDDGTVIVKTGWESKYGTKIVEKEEPVYADAEESLQIMQDAVNEGTMTEAQAQAMLEMGEPVQKGTKKIYVEEETLIENKPTHSVRNIMNIYIDPTCGGIIADAGFLIEEYDISWAELKEKEYKEKVVIDKETGEKRVESTGVYKNLKLVNIDKAASTIVDEYETDSRNSFTFNDKARKKLRAYEYWGYWDVDGNGELTAIVATWIGGVIVRMEENPFPHKRIPYSIAQYMTVADEIYGEPDAEILKENQDSIGQMTRAAHDITGTQAIGQEFIDENFLGPSQRNAYEKGNQVYYRSGFNPEKAIYRRKVEPVDQTVFQMISMQKKDAEEMSGTVPFNVGSGGNALGGVATGIKSAMDATSKRELSILRNLSDMFIDMARMVISMNQSYMPEEQIIRITDDEFTTIRRDDLDGDIDITLEISTPEKDNETAERLMKLMQTNSASMSKEMAKLHYIELALLWKRPDFAKKIEELEEPVDPAKDELIKLQIENERLKNEKLKMEMLEAQSRIEERISRTTENETDIEKKSSEAELKRNMARKLASETDELDRKFVKEMSGEARQEHLENEDIKDRQKQDERVDKHLSDVEKLRLAKENYKTSNKSEPAPRQRTKQTTAQGI